MTNSPPSKVNLHDSGLARVLCYGIDTLVLTVNILWQNDEFFNLLSRAKDEASFLDDEVQVELKSWNDDVSLLFNLKPFGKNGYEWILISGEYTISIGNWIEPGSRPSVLIEIRSETLHKHGPIEAVEIILSALVYAEANIIITKVSRVDLYCDVLLPEFCWTKETEEYLVTRAKKRSSHKEGLSFSGLSIGRGAIMARLYDKPLEILKSGKTWMYEIWGIEKVPAGHNVIRVEFQARRTKIKELGIDTFHDLIEQAPNLWAYCTQNWLKLQDNPGKHHTQRHTFDWWKTVQSGYKGAQDATPLVSLKAASQNEDQLARQAIGSIASLIAIRSKGKMPNDDKLKALSCWLEIVLLEVDKYGASPKDLELKIKNKMAKYGRSSDAYSKTLRYNTRHDLALKSYSKEKSKIRRDEFYK